MVDNARDGAAKDSVDVVLGAFDKKKDLLVELCLRTRSLIEDLLKYSNVGYQYVQSRVKNRDKLRDKYLDKRKNYKRLDDITDLAALRVITYYEDEVDRVAEILQREFDIDRANSIDRRETEPDKFGYYALNYVCKYTEERTKHAEYRRFAGLSFEIQITSVLRHAWAEIEHPWYDLKEAFPDNIRRRFARMAALLEIAESEFLSLRKLQEDYKRSVELRVQADVTDLPVDVVSVRSFVEQEALAAEIDRKLAAAFDLRPPQGGIPDQAVELFTKAANFSGMRTLASIQQALAEFGSSAVEFAKRANKEVWPEMRHGPNAPPLIAGSSVFHVAMFSVALEGVERATQFLRDIGFTPSWDVDRQVALTREIYKKPAK